MPKLYPENEAPINVPRFEEANGFYTTPQKSKQMSKIRAKHSKPERLLRKSLWAAGLRYRIHVANFPGKPDIIIKKYRLAIFVDGSFWHGYDWEARKEKIKTNAGFWLPKIARNQQRDRTANRELQKMGFHVMRFWDFEVLKNPGACVKQVLDYIYAKNYPG